MKIVLQRVTRAQVSVSGNVIGAIQKGLLLLVGVAPGDTEAMSEVMLEKIVNLRIFSDAEGKMNLSLLDAGGELLVVSQFTLYADCRKGRRPGFTDAAPPDFAKAMYQNFVEKCRARNIKTEQGEFGADMLIDFVNDGPVTIILDSKDFSQTGQS